MDKCLLEPPDASACKMGATGAVDSHSGLRYGASRLSVLVLYKLGVALWFPVASHLFSHMISK